MQSKNVQMNAAWTATQPIKGWRHYRISGIRKGKDGGREWEMMAVCDRSVRFWVGSTDLASQERWLPGWR